MRLAVASLILLACLLAAPFSVDSPSFRASDFAEEKTIPSGTVTMCIEWVVPRSLAELVENSNLIIIGEGLVPDGYPADFRGMTHNVRVEQVFRKPQWFSSEKIYVNQFGASPPDAEVSSPYYPGIRVGERSVMVLGARRGEDGVIVYGLKGPAGRFVIQSNRVYSLNWAYPEPETYAGLYFPVKGQPLSAFLRELVAGIPATPA